MESKKRERKKRSRTFPKRGAREKKKTQPLETRKQRVDYTDHSYGRGFQGSGRRSVNKGGRKKKKNGEEEEETLQPPTTRGSLMAS